MTEIDNSEHQKKITLTTIDGRSWTAEFVGRITRRDIKRLNRVLTVEFAKVQRKRSVEKLRRGRLADEARDTEASIEETPNEVQSESTADKETQHVYKPK